MNYEVEIIILGTWIFCVGDSLLIKDNDIKIILFEYPIINTEF